MDTLLRLVDVITSDTLTLAASGVLALAILALLVLIAWPAREGSRSGEREHARAGTRTTQTRSARAITARTLAASGVAAADIARQTGLSRDALALLTGIMSANARQKAPPSARPSLFQRLRGNRSTTVASTQVPA